MEATMSKAKTKNITKSRQRIAALRVVRKPAHSASGGSKHRSATMNMTVNLAALKDSKPTTGAAHVKRKAGKKSQYELYPMPFFSAAAQDTWTAKPSDDYTADCELGRAHAIRFLQSCDGTVGWASTFSQIVGDMISKGPQGKRWGDGHVSPGGVVVGFMSTIGKALAIGLSYRKVDMIDGAQKPDPILAAIQRHCDLQEALDRTYAALDAAQGKAAKKLGNRPVGLVTWRNYIIGGSELEDRRAALRKEGFDPKVVENEYRDAKKRERAIQRAKRDWDRRAGLVEQRQKMESIGASLDEARQTLAKVKPTTPAGAGKLIAHIRNDLDDSEISEWQKAALVNVASSLVLMRRD
jgi:hypothetical protein